MREGFVHVSASVRRSAISLEQGEWKEFCAF